MAHFARIRQIWSLNERDSEPYPSDRRRDPMIRTLPKKNGRAKLTKRGG